MKPSRSSLSVPTRVHITITNLKEMQPIRLREQLGAEARDDLLNDYVFNSILVCARPFQQMFDEGTQTPARILRKGRKKTFEPGYARKRVLKRRGNSKEEDGIAMKSIERKKEAEAGVRIHTPKLRNTKKEQASGRQTPEIPMSKSPKVRRLATTMQETQETAADSRRGNSENSRSKRKVSKSPKFEPAATPEIRLKALYLQVLR